MGSNLGMILILGTVLHLIVFGVMLWIRLRRWDAVDTTRERKKAAPCAVCGEPATRRSYDGLDPDEQHDPHTGRPYSLDLAHYRPLCPVH